MGESNLEMLLATLVGEVHGMRAALEAMAIANSPEPRMVKPLSEYEGFDWSVINATVVARDKDGPSLVEWGGFQWKRRSRDDYGKDIFFTRPNGKLPDGKVRYIRLITFKGDMGKVKPVPEATREAMAAMSIPRTPSGGAADSGAKEQTNASSRPTKQPDSGQSCAECLSTRESSASQTCVAGRVRAARHQIRRGQDRQRGRHFA